MLKKRSKKRHWGQICLISAAILNAFVLLVHLHLSGLEDELANKRADEGYFIKNKQTISAENAKRTILHTSLNQLKMLRRLARDRLTPSENEMLLMDEKTLQNEIDASLRKIVGATYLQANDPPQGKDTNKMFNKMTNEQLLALIPELQDQEWQFAENLKMDMVSLMDQVSFWKKLHSSALIISMIILIVANFLIYASRESE